MIDRTYLPYRSARNYGDRKMAKWMGFFLSEHNTALTEDRQRIDFSRELTEMEKGLLLGQAYISRLTLILDIKNGHHRKHLKGVLMELGEDWVIVKSNRQFHRIALIDILGIGLEEGIEDEDATSTT